MADEGSKLIAASKIVRIADLKENFRFIAHQTRVELGVISREFRDLQKTLDTVILEIKEVQRQIAKIEQKKFENIIPFSRDELMALRLELYRLTALRTQMRGKVRALYKAQTAYKRDAYLPAQRKHDHAKLISRRDALLSRLNHQEF